MRLILTRKPHYQHPILRSSCRLCTHHTPASLSVFETELHIATRLDFSRRQHSHHTPALKFSISSFEAAESFYRFLQSRSSVMSVLITSLTQQLISFWNGPEHRWLTRFLFLIVVFWSRLPRCIYCPRWLTDCCFMTDCCCCREQIHT